jgi:hypothetical protein
MLPVTLAGGRPMRTLLLSRLSATVTPDLNMRQNHVAAEWAEKSRIRRYLRRRANERLDNHKARVQSLSRQPNGPRSILATQFAGGRRLTAR